ncbi:glycosyltransferase family 2 protein [Streptomyces jumonjinensis]|uniref:Glycosyltransferase family 2 protein n=1 Tax=Streptomyces jumonjinensis TaxID=1945 RepID=A0A646KTM8_STRJU|nr:glycosyltransferase family 2 protein [Streptomyces jumonjinensis]MQT05654.1 glycosyltransferase family 2 protein [Streptomyces jumonjinensis]
MVTTVERPVLVVVPALNEADCIRAVVGEIRTALPAADVLVVDDGSTDATAARARAAGALVASLPYNLGVGGAIRLGYRYAAARDYHAVVQIDADGQHDPRYAHALLDRLDAGADLVIGARFAGEGDYAVAGPRRWAMVVLGTVLSWLSGTRLTDVTSGMRAASRPLVEVFAVQYPVEYLGDTVETLAMAARRGFRVRQVPVAMRTRAGGRPSQRPLRACLYLVRVLLAVLLALIRR